MPKECHDLGRIEKYPAWLWFLISLVPNFLTTLFFKNCKEKKNHRLFRLAGIIKMKGATAITYHQGLFVFFRTIKRFLKKTF